MPTAPEDHLRDLVQAWAAAVRRRDIHGVLENHDEDLLFFDRAPPAAARGLEAYRWAWEGGPAPWLGDAVRFSLRDLRVIAGDQVAWATAVADCAATERGARLEFTLRLTFGFVRRSAGWRIVHEHHSEPVLLLAA